MGSVTRATHPGDAPTKHIVDGDAGSQPHPRRPCPPSETPRSQRAQPFVAVV